MCLKSSSQGGTLGEGWEWSSYFHRLLCFRKLPVTASHVSLVYWQGTFLLRSSFVLPKYNLCRTWSTDNVDDPVFHAQSSLSRYCCPSLGPSSILVQKRKKKKTEMKRKETIEINLDTDGKSQTAHCPPLEATPSRPLPLTFPGIPSHTG